jgi:hypothetical protein
MRKSVYDYDKAHELKSFDTYLLQIDSADVKVDISSVLFPKLDTKPRRSDNGSVYTLYYTFPAG